MIKKFKLFEKLGYNEDVENFANKIIEIVESKVEQLKSGELEFASKCEGSKIDDLCYSYIMPLDNDIILNNTEIKEFRVIIYNSIKKHSMLIKKDENDELNITLKLSVEDFNVKKSSINHEIMHMFQKLSGKVLPKLNRDVNLRRRYLKKDEDYDRFRYLIYVTSNSEINARVQSCYISLKDKGTTKETFKENLLEEYDYKVLTKITDYLDKIKETENPKKFINGFLKKLNKDKRVTEEEAKTYLDNKIEYFEKQKRKLKTKLIKLYELF